MVSPVLIQLHCVNCARCVSHGHAFSYGHSHRCGKFAPAALILFAALAAMTPAVAMAQSVQPQAETKSVESAAAAEFPAPYNSERDTKGAMPPAEAVQAVTLPPGFHAVLTAAEPDVQNPIAMTQDARGRLWVAENYTYAERALRFDLKLQDRVVILEDSDGDGRAEKRSVFSDDLQMLTGLALGRGGLFVMCPPQVLFIPDRNGDDKPDGPAEVVLDGFHVAQENYHNFANGLKWGRDGWLYGRCGASCPGEVGLPGSAPEDRVALRGGLWRYHPVRQVFESLNQGTTNPWGHDWNSVGEPFYINTVNGHLWHVVPGAHFVRPHSIDANPHSYQLIDMHADHWHFDTGKSWTDSRGGAANDYGGGHAHIGCMIYQGGSWPEKYRDKLFTINMHGRRINVERLEREGGGYSAKHEPDFALFGDTWFRGMELDYGPDGNVFVIDWSDTGECHDSDGVHRTSGRIYKIVYDEATRTPNAPVTPEPLGKALSPIELAGLHIHPNQWFVRQARRALLDGSFSDETLKQVEQKLRTFASAKSTDVVKLDVLWTLFALGRLTTEEQFKLLDDQNEFVRIAGLRMLSDAWPIDTPRGTRPSASEAANPSADMLGKFASLAKSDSSAAVRLTLASVLQRLPHAARGAIATPLAAHEEDDTDHNIPLMIWYGIAPLGDTHPNAIIDVARESRLTTVSRLAARRLGELSTKNPEHLDKVLEAALSKDPSARTAMAYGIGQALAGVHKAKRPAHWETFARTFEQSSDTIVKEQVRQLSALFGDGRTLDELKRIVRDGKSDMASRLSAFESLVEIRADGLRELCEQMIGQRYLNAVAAKGLARENDSAIGDKLVKGYRNFAPTDRPGVIEVLASRPAWARSLLIAVESNQIPKSDLTASQARQMNAHGDDDVDRLLEKVWGQVKSTPQDKLDQIERIKKLITAGEPKADLKVGAALFKKACSNCHKLYGEGGKIGPDLTGAQRQNPAYLSITSSTRASS
ncbi:MAG: PVC-type heme-binding CxxCH protein [Pirellulales bacterium]